MRILAEPRYLECAESKHAEFISAEPYPHTVIDDFLPEDLCNEVLGEFPSADQLDWIRFNDPTGLKLASKHDSQLQPTTERVLQELNSAAALQFLEKLTGIEALISDPYFEGAGLHQIQRGGFLKIHADFNRHPKLQLERRLNLLLYLNKNWEEEYGGHLELWDRTMSTCVKRIAPVFNRCVVITTDDWSYHGHPDPLQCPDDMSRKSLAMYYYTATRPAQEKSATHATLYQQRPEEVQRQQSASYKLRQGAAYVLDKSVGLLMKPAQLVRYVETKIRPPSF